MFQRLLGPITKQYGGIQYNTIPESNAVSAYGDFGFLGSDVIKHIMFFLSSKDFCTASQLNNSFNKLAHDAPYTVVKLVHTRNADNRIYDLTYQQAILIHSTLSLRKEAAEKILQDGNINADVVKIVLSEIQRKSDLKNRYEHAKKELVKAYYETTFYKDIVERYKVKNVDIMESLMNYALDNNATLFSVSAFGRILKEKGVKSSKKTVSLYLKYLEDAGLIRMVMKASNKNIFFLFGLVSMMMTILRKEIDEKLPHFYFCILHHDNSDPTSYR